MKDTRARILITDTNMHVLRKLKHELTKNDYEVFVADNAEKFSVLLSLYCFDLILLDVTIIEYINI